MADRADRRDADLVVDVRGGSAASFSALFDRWFGPVLGAAQDIVGEQTEAARVATETFQSVWQHLDELADPEGFGAWVLLTSRTFARQRLAERDPSAPAPSGPLFDSEDELRRAVAKVLCRRQVPALGEMARVRAGTGGADPDLLSAQGAGPGPGAELPELATDRLHRYHWAVADPAPGVADRIRTFRLSPGTVVALAIVLLGSVIWLINRDDSSEIDGGRPTPLFSPASPTTIDGAAARSDNGVAVPGGEATSPESVAPDPVAPAPAEAVAPSESRKVKVATVLPRAVATTPSRRGTTAAPATAVPITAVSITTVPGSPPADRPSSTTATVAPSSSATTASTARTTTTAEAATTSTTARTTTTARGGSTTTTAGVTTTTRGGSTTTTAGATTTTTRAGSTTTDGVTTTRATASTTEAVTISRPTTTPTVTSTTRATTGSTAAILVVGVPLNN